jgi:Secretion system C-terminal sorting domain
LDKSGGLNYYRLRQVDKDGKYTYSKIVSVLFTDNGVFAIGPNPANDFIIVAIPSSNAASDIFIYTVDGKGVLRQQVAANNTSAQINIGALTAGVYSVVLIQDGKKEIMKLVKK